MKLKIENRPRFNTESIVHQVKAATHKSNRIAMTAGFILGSFVPAASYELVHYEVASQPMLWILVTGGLTYSALTVYQWAKVAFKHPAKALGFVVLLEGILTFSASAWLSGSALALLVAINGVSAGCQLALDYKNH